MWEVKCSLPPLIPLFEYAPDIPATLRLLQSPLNNDPMKAFILQVAMPSRISDHGEGNISSGSGRSFLWPPLP